MRTTHPELTLREAEAVLARRLVEITPPGHPIRPTRSRPVAVLIGGTPGTGKSTIQWQVQASLGAETVAVYDYDDDLAAHPRYDAIMRSHGLRSAHVVALSLPSSLRLNCLKHLREGEPQYDVIASAPLHRQRAVKMWADGFRAVDYRIALVYVVTNQANSDLGRAARLQQSIDDTGIGRWVDPGLCVQTDLLIPDTAHAIELAASVDDIYVVDRDGYVLYENHRGEDGRMAGRLLAKEAILGERLRPATPIEHQQFLATALPLLERRDELLPPVYELVRAAKAREDARPAPQLSLIAPSPANRLDQRLIDLQRISGSGVAAPRLSLGAWETPGRADSADDLRHAAPGGDRGRADRDARDGRR